MLRRSNIISGGEGTRSSHRQFIVSRLNRCCASPPLNAASNKARMSVGVFSPENSGSAAFRARSAAHQLSPTTATHPPRETTLRTPGAPLTASPETPLSRPPGGATRTDANNMPGRRTSLAKRRLPSHFAGPSSLRQRLSGQPLLHGSAEPRVTGRRAISGLFGKLAERKGSFPVDHEPVGDVAFLGRDVPPVCCRSHQHHPRSRRGLPQWLLKSAHGGRTRGDPGVVGPALILG